MNILFVCEYNACRSQMAEGLARSFLPKGFSIMSAGLYPGALHPITIEMMKEIGIDISSQRSKLLEAVEEDHFNYLVVLAEPAVPATQHLNVNHRLDWFYPDPAKTEGNVETVKAAIRVVRDALKTRIEEFFLK